MRKKTMKAVALAAMAGMLFQLGGCLNLNQLLRQGMFYFAFEYLTDQDTVADIFVD